jgi:hypothetical protein
MHIYTDFPTYQCIIGGSSIFDIVPVIDNKIIRRTVEKSRTNYQPGLTQLSELFRIIFPQPFKMGLVHRAAPFRDPIQLLANQRRSLYISYRAIPMFCSAPTPDRLLSSCGGAMLAPGSPAAGKSIYLLMWRMRPRLRSGSDNPRLPSAGSGFTTRWRTGEKRIHPPDQSPQ